MSIRIRQRMSDWPFRILSLSIIFLPISWTMALQKYVSTITTKLNETLYSTNSTLANIDPQRLYQALIDLQNVSFPALEI